MRAALASVLSLMLAAAPAMGADPLKPYAGFSQDGRHVMILVPADRLDDIQRELANAQDLRKDVMIVMPFEQFSRVADVAAIDQKLSGPAAASAPDISTSAAPSREQTSVQTSESATTTQSSAAASPSLPSGSATGSTGMMAQSGTGSTSTTTTTEQSTSASSPGASGSASALPPAFENKAILLVPYDQMGSVSQAAGSDREILVVIPYDKFRQVADVSKLQSTGQTASGAAPSREQTSTTTTTTTTTQSGPAMGADRLTWSEFHRDHVMLLVPSDKLKSFSQISTSGDRPIYVLMPLDQFNRVVEVKTSGLQPSREQTSFQPGSTATTTTTTTTTTALPPAYGDTGRTFFLHNLQEANSVLQWEPAAGGTIVTLRDGSVLMVPDSVKIRGALQTGARVRGEFEQRGGQNLVTWLEVIDITNNKSD
ncbi:MAG: hypothetical protein ACE147_11555 [Candidatus Methylomirabilales bacterium]